MKYPKLRWLEVGIRAPVTDNEASILVDTVSADVWSGRARTRRLALHVL